MLELQQVLVIDFGVPVEISAVVWVVVCRIVVINQRSGPGSASEVCGVIRVPWWTLFLIQLGVAVCYDGSFFHLLLPDNRRIPHQLLLVFVEDFRWRIRCDKLSA